MKNRTGRRCVVAIVSADQKPLVAHEASPPCATAMLPRDVLVVQDLRAILQRLRPADGRRVLRTDAAAGGQHARDLRVRGKIEHDADVAAFADAARAHHRRGQRIFDSQAERQHQRPRAVVHTDAVACAGQHLSEQHLGDVVAARGELIEHLAFRQQPRFLQLIEGARHQHGMHDPLPIHSAGGPVGLDSGVGSALIRFLSRERLRVMRGSLRAARKWQNSTNRVALGFRIGDKVASVFDYF